MQQSKGNKRSTLISHKTQNNWHISPNDIFSWWWRHLWSPERPPTLHWCSWLPEKILSPSRSFSISACGTSLHTTNQLCGSVKTAPFKSMVHQDGIQMPTEREPQSMWKLKNDKHWRVLMWEAATAAYSNVSPWQEWGQSESLSTRDQ
jgi:hypothetical protein